MNKKLQKLMKAINSHMKETTKTSGKLSGMDTSFSTPPKKPQKPKQFTREELLERIHVFDKLKHCIFNKRKVQELTLDILKQTPYPYYSVSILFCGNKYITQLNEKDRKRKGPTDILSYPLYSPDLEHNFALMDSKNGMDAELAQVLANEHKLIMEEEKSLGEMVISQPYIMDYCKENNMSLNHHMALLLTHGILHLMGYDHEKDADYAKMKAKEDEILETFKKHPKMWAELDLLEHSEN